MCNTLAPHKRACCRRKSEGNDEEKKSFQCSTCDAMHMRENTYGSGDIYRNL
jgi:hypothetical protein